MNTDNAGQQAQKAADAVTQHPAMRALMRVGIVSYGIVHLLIAWIALQVAWGGSKQNADQSGALQQLSDTPIGVPLLWVLGIGLFALALWQLIEAIFGYRDVPDDQSGRKRLVKKVGAGGKAVVYALLGWLAISVATGSGKSSGDQGKESMTAELMSSGFGRFLVIAVGLAIVGVGVAGIVKGFRKKFVEDLAGSPSTSLIRLGQVGHIAKGAATALIGGLFGWAALSYDPEKAGGLDDALKTLASAPFGQFLLSAVAIGLACFGVYCFGWARNPRT